MSDEESKLDPRLSRLVAIKGELELRNALYSEYDRIILELAKEGFNHAANGSFIYILKDNLAGGEKNTVWRALATQRYELEVITKELAEKREVKRLKEAK